MTFSMTPLRGRHQLAAAVLALLAGSAFAQATTPAPTPAASGAHRQATGHGERHERHSHYGRS